MNLKELDSFKLSDAVKFHDRLNPKLWYNNRLRPEVKKQLKKIAEDFIDELGISGLDVDDLTISGSNSAYSYTPHSDLDLHILVDMNKLPNDEVYRELFNAKKTIYNDSHNIKLHGVPVELYVQDTNEPVVSLGEYSLLKDKWLKIPSKRRANFDQNATMAKYEKLHTLVQHALKSKNIDLVQTIIKKIKQYRQAGLDKGGEFGPENLAYKALRNQGYITKLYDLRDKLHSRELSLNGMYANPRRVADEDYDPNGPPPGPEFKPTMPAGTVRVDVSDVYDWYKLGQHISNLKGLGKHDFGAGPPSTIMAFGSEPEEHKYIDYLKKTGLTTTDIDPVDPNQPKSMPRQKVDPTYNVNEMPDTSGPVGVQLGGWRTYRPKVAEGSEQLDVDYYMNEGCGIFAVAKALNSSNAKIYVISKNEGEAWSNNFPYELTHVFVYIPNQGTIDVKGNRTPEQMAKDFHLFKNDYSIKGPFSPKEFYSRFMGNSDAKPLYGTKQEINQLQKQLQVKQDVAEGASGYIPSNAEKNDPRFKTALTVDIKPDTMKKNAKAFGSKISRAGIPPTLRPSGKF